VQLRTRELGDRQHVLRIGQLPAGRGCRERAQDRLVDDEEFCDPLRRF
jgi:hypothetical protein